MATRASNRSRIETLEAFVRAFDRYIALSVAANNTADREAFATISAQREEAAAEMQRRRAAIR